MDVRDQEGDIVKPNSRIQSGSSHRRARWTAWELLLLGTSLVLIASPLMAMVYAMLVPTGLKAQVRDGSQAGVPLRATVNPSASTLPTATSRPTQTASPTVIPATPTKTQPPSSPTVAASSTTIVATSTVTVPTSTVAVPTPTATQDTVRPDLIVRMDAINTVGQSIRTVSPDMAFNFYIYLDYDVPSPMAVHLYDVLPSSIEIVSIDDPFNGSCAVKTNTVDCTMQPWSGHPSTVLIGVKVRAETANGTVTNVVKATIPTTTIQAEDSVELTIIGDTSKTPTASPTNVATSTPTLIAATPTPTEQIEPTNVPVPTEVPQPTTPLPTNIPEPTQATTPTDVPEPTRAPVPPAPPRPAPRPHESTPTPDGTITLPITVVPSETTSVPTLTPTVAVAISETPIPATPQPSTPSPLTPTATAVSATATGTSQPVPDAPSRPVSTPAQNPTLTRGAQGPAVSVLQQHLNAWIARNPAQGLQPLRIDGIFGAATEQAVRRFQSALGLQVDGIVGSQTWAHLLTIGTPSDVPSRPVPAQPQQPAVSAPATSTPTSSDTTVSGTSALAATPTLGPTLPPLTTPLPANTGKAAFQFNLHAGTERVAAGEMIIYTIKVQQAGLGVGGSAPNQSPPSASPQGPTLTNVIIGDEISPALEVIAAHGIGIAVEQDGQKITARKTQMHPGDSALVVIGARVRSDVALPEILNQASLSADGMPPIFSNVTTLTVLDPRRPAAAPVAQGSTNAPASSAAPQSGTSALPNVGTKLPAGSSGAPLSGFVLFGLTLLLRALRIHRTRQEAT